MEKILIRTPVQLKETLKTTAKSRGHSLNAFILQILWEWESDNITQDKLATKQNVNINHL